MRDVVAKYNRLPLAGRKPRLSPVTLTRNYWQPSPGHDDVIKWKHFPSYWPFLWGIHRPQRAVTRSFDFFYLRLNERLRKQSWGWWFETPWSPLWRHSNEMLGFCFHCHSCSLPRYVCANERIYFDANIIFTYCASHCHHCMFESIERIECFSCRFWV